MLQRLPIVLAQVNVGDISENVLMKSNKLYILRIEQKKVLRNYIMI